MCYKAILENGGTLMYVPHALEFVPECFMTQEIYSKAVNRCFFLYLILFLIGIKLKKCMTELHLKILF